MLSKALAIGFLFAGIGLCQIGTPTQQQIRYITTNPTGNACTATAIALRAPNGTLYSCQNGVYAAISGGGGGGTVTSTSVVTANGLSGTVANPTTTPAITLSSTLAGDTSGPSGANTTTKINGTALSGLATGPLCNTTSTGVPFTCPSPTVATVLGSLQGTVKAAYLMTDGSGSTLTDSSANAYNGTITGATWVNTSYLHFSGSSQYVSIPVAASSALTWQVFFRQSPNLCTSGSACDQFMYLLSSDNGYRLQTNGSSFGNWTVFNNTTNTNTSSEKWSGWSSVGFVLGSPVVYYKNGLPAIGSFATANVANMTASSTFLIGAFAGVTALAFAGDVAAVVAYTGALTGTQIASNDKIIRDYIQSAKGIAIQDNVNYSRAAMSFVGDSTTNNYSTFSERTSYPYMVSQVYPDYEFFNFGGTGAVLGQIASQITSQVTPMAARFSGPGASIVVGSAGTNDVAASTAAATIYTGEQTLCTDVHLIPGAKCVLSTIAAASRNSGAQETIRAAANALIVTGYLNGGLGADGLFDIGGDPILGVSTNTGNTYYWADNVHWATPGKQIVANRAALAIASARGVSNRPIVLNVTVPRGNLIATSATTGTVPLLQLSSNQKLCGVTIKPLSPSKGTSISAATVSIGDSLGTATQYAPAYSVFAAASNTNFQDTPLFNSTSYAGGVVGAYWTTTGANVNAVYTDLVVDATLNTKVTSSSYNFVAADVGTDIYISAGSGWTVGSYHINSVAANAATLDRSPAAISTTGGSYALGEISVDICVVTAP